jgi:hypothetical protein
MILLSVPTSLTHSKRSKCLRANISQIKGICIRTPESKVEQIVAANRRQNRYEAFQSGFGRSPLENLHSRLQSLESHLE